MCVCMYLTINLKIYPSGTKLRSHHIAFDKVRLELDVTSTASRETNDKVVDSLQHPRRWIADAKCRSLSALSLSSD